MNPIITRAMSFRLILASVFATLAYATFFQFGQPWLAFHADNLVVYDCRLQSKILPIGTKYPGRIDEIFVEIGQRVSAGECIARMESRELDAEIEKAKATIELTQANVRAESIAIEKAIATMLAQQKCLDAKSKVAASRFKAANIESGWINKELTRARRLAKRGSISNAALEKIGREFDNFANRALIAGEEDLIANLDLAAIRAEIEQIHARSAKLAVLEQQIQIAKSDLALVEAQKRATHIRSHNSGIVTDIFCGAGSSVKVGDPIVQIQDDAIWCEAWIEEDKFTEILNNAPASLTLKSYPSDEITGSVACFLPTPESLAHQPQTSTNPILHANSKICIKIDLVSTPDLQLIPGMTGTAAIRKPESRPAESSIVAFFESKR